MFLFHRRILSLPALQQAAFRFWFAKGYAYLFPISTLFDYSSSEGATEDDLLDAYPRLSRQDIQAAIGYAADTLAHEETLIARNT
jgi:hypothetical protein